MTKKQLRQKYLTLRRRLSPSEISAYSTQIFEQFRQSFTLETGQKVHVFLPIEKFQEIHTRLFIEWFWAHGQRVFVPKVVGEEMISIEIHPETIFEISPWGIPEPVGKASENKEFDFVLTPLIYADGRGHRVGYGKGFYDRFFQALPRPAIKVGLGIFPPSETIGDAGQYDIRLDYLVTPEAVLSFAGVSG